MKMPRDVQIGIGPDGLAHFVADVTKVDRIGHSYTWLLRCGGHHYTSSRHALVEAEAVTCFVCSAKGPV